MLVTGRECETEDFETSTTDRACRDRVVGSLRPRVDDLRVRPHHDENGDAAHPVEVAPTF